MFNIKNIKQVISAQMHEDDYDADMESEVYHNHKETERCRDNSELLGKVMELLNNYKGEQL